MHLELRAGVANHTAAQLTARAVVIGQGHIVQTAAGWQVNPFHRIVVRQAAVVAAADAVNRPLDAR